MRRGARPAVRPAVLSGVLPAALLISLSLAVGQEESVQFEEGNRSYRSGDYTRAAQLYEQVEKNGYESPALYYNLGNSYFKLKNIPAAILQYERAKRIAPHDEDILYNLRLANIRVIDKIDPLPRLFFIEWWNSSMNLFSSSAWGTIAIVCLWCAALGGGMVVISRSSGLQRAGLLFAVLAIAIGIFSFTGAYERVMKEQQEQAAIVFAPSVSVKSAPDAGSTDLFVVHEGVKVEVLDAVGGWRKIHLADGKVGWIPAGSAQLI